MSRSAAEEARRDRFTAIYEANYHRIRGYALRRASRDEAADLVAETFLVAWRRLEEVPDGEAARLWLYGTARRILANHERARRRRERLCERARTERVSEPEPSRGDAGLPAAAFRTLRPDERELLALVAWEGLDVGEIAQLYACSRNAVRIRIHRARRHFARELTRLGVSPKENSGGGQVSQASRQRVGALVETEDSL